MDRVKFEELVSAAVGALPDEFITKLENVDVVVQDGPTTDQLRRARLRHGYLLLGLYEGVPRTKRGQHYGIVPPDKITIFQKSIEEKCG
jgi:predicted Zn-dependent protease with MMP-like domain